MPSPLLVLALMLTGPPPQEPPTPESLTCYSTVFEPFVMEEAGGVRGLDVEVVREVGRRLGLVIDVALMPWSRLEAEIREGAPRIHCAFAYFRTEAREAYMEYTTVPLHTTRYVLFVQKERAAEFAEPHGVAGTRLAVNRGFQLLEPLRSAVDEGWIDLVEVQEETQSLRMLDLGRVDAVLTDHSVGEFVLDRLGLEGIVAVEPPVGVSPAFLVFPRSADLGHLVPRFDEALLAMEEDGAIEEIRHRMLSD